MTEIKNVDKNQQKNYFSPYYHTKKAIQSVINNEFYLSYYNLHNDDKFKIVDALCLDLNTKKTKYLDLYYKNENVIKSLFFHYESKNFGLNKALRSNFGV